MDIETTKTSKSRWLATYYGSMFFCLVLVGLGMAFFIIKPKIDVFKLQNADVAAAVETLQTEQAYVNSLEQSIAAAQTIVPDVLRQVDEALPREQRIPELLVLFGKVADRNQVKISNIAFADAVSAPKSTTSSIRELSINMTVVAENYPRIKKFIRDLETSLRILDVVAINVSSQGEEAAYALQLRAYSYAPSAKNAPTSQR